MQRKCGFVLPPQRLWWCMGVCVEFSKIIKAGQVWWNCTSLLFKFSKLCASSRIRPYEKLRMKTNGYHLRRKQVCYFLFSFTFYHHFYWLVEIEPGILSFILLSIHHVVLMFFAPPIPLSACMFCTLQQWVKICWSFRWDSCQVLLVTMCLVCMEMIC